MPLTSVILAGGESRRMGTDKAVLEVGGQTLLERTARTLLAAGGRVIVAGRGAPAGWPLPAVDFAPDAEPGLGPLGGLETALGHAAADVLAVACDLPLLTADAVRWLRGCWERQEQKGGHGVVVVNGERWEPLFAVYRPACLPRIRSRLAEGRRSLHGLIQAGDFAFVSAPEWVCARLANVNTPEQWGAVKKQV